MMVKSSKILFFIKTKEGKWETKSQAAIRGDMKGVLLQNSNIHKERKHRKNKDRWMEGRGKRECEEGQKKREKDRKRDRNEGGSQGAALTVLPPLTPTPTPTLPHLTLCLEALKHKSLWERVERQHFNQIFIQWRSTTANLWPLVLLSTHIHTSGGDTQNQKGHSATHSNVKTHNIHTHNGKTWD